MSSDKNEYICNDTNKKCGFVCIDHCTNHRGISYKVCSVFTFMQSVLPNLSLHSGSPEIKKNVC